MANPNTLPKDILEKCKQKFCEKYNVSDSYFENVWRSQWKTVKNSMDDITERSSIRINNLGSFLLKTRKYARYIDKVVKNRKRFSNNAD